MRVGRSRERQAGMGRSRECRAGMDRSRERQDGGRCVPGGRGRAAGDEAPPRGPPDLPEGTEGVPGFGARLRRGGLGLRHRLWVGGGGGPLGEEIRQPLQDGDDDPDDSRAKRDPLAEAPEGLAELIEFAGCPPALAAGIAEGLERGVQLDGRFPEEMADPFEDPSSRRCLRRRSGAATLAMRWPVLSEPPPGLRSFGADPRDPQPDAAKPGARLPEPGADGVESRRSLRVGDLVVRFGDGVSGTKVEAGHARASVPESMPSLRPFICLFLNELYVTYVCDSRLYRWRAPIDIGSDGRLHPSIAEPVGVCTHR